MGIVYVAESYDSIKIGRCKDETERQNSLKNEFGVPSGYFIKLAFRCKKSGKSKEVEDKFLAKFEKYKVERYKGSTRDDESRESFDRKKMSTIIKKMKKYADKKGYIIKKYNPYYEYHEFESLLDRRGKEHEIEFFVKWKNGEKSWVHYDCIPESLILEEGWETHDMLDIPEPPEDDSDDDWEPSYKSKSEPEITTRKRVRQQPSRISKRNKCI